MIEEWDRVSVEDIQARIAEIPWRCTMLRSNGGSHKRVILFGVDLASLGIPVIFLAGSYYCRLYCAIPVSHVVLYRI